MAKTAAQKLDEVMRRGRRIHRPAFSVYYLPQSAPPKPRIVAGQKVDKRATARNLIRRRIREILRVKLPSGIGIVVITRKPILELTYGQLKMELNKMLDQIK